MLENENTNNIKKGEGMDINTSETLINPEINDMKATAVDEIKSEGAISEINTKVNDNLKNAKKPFKKGRQSEFFCGLKAGIIDTIIMLVISGILLCITGVIMMYILGYYITNIFGMLFIFLVIVSILYPAFKNCYKFSKMNKIKK